MAVDRKISYSFVVLPTWHIFILSAVLPLAANARPDNMDYFSIVKETFTVPPGGLTCEEIAKKTGSPLADLLYLNDALPALCGSVLNPLPVTEGSTVALVPQKTKTPENGNRVPCTAVYSTVKGDSCEKIVSIFSDSITLLDVETLTLMNFESELNCSNPIDLLDSRKMICVQRSQKTTIEKVRTDDYSVNEGDRGCEFLYHNRTKSVDFFSLNPGIDCDNLIPGDLVRIAPEPELLTERTNQVGLEASVCSQICTKQYTLPLVMLCPIIQTRFYKSNKTIFRIYDCPSSNLCDSSGSLPAKKVLCIP